MSATSAKLTKRVIDAEAPGPARRFIWDTDLRGFGLRIEPTGTKTFLVRYRPKNSGRLGPKRFVTIGRYGPMTPDQARSEARAVLGRVATGEDPTETSKKERDAPTFAQLSERYLAELVIPKKKGSTAGLYAHYLRALVVPTLGSKKAADVKHADIVTYLISRLRPPVASRSWRER